MLTPSCQCLYLRLVAVHEDAWRHRSRMSQEYTRDEVKTHSTDKSAWIIIDALVYDITRFAAMHPGGELLILEYAGCKTY